MLLCHVLREAGERGFTRLHLDADPEAAPFYLHFGAIRLGSTLSGSIPGRLLPRLEFRLDSSGTSGSPVAKPTTSTHSDGNLRI